MVDAAATAAPDVDAPKVVTLTGIPGGEPYPDVPLAVVIGNHGRVKVKLLAEYWPPSETDYNYKRWPGVLWALEFGDVAAAKAFREDVDRFVQGWVESHAEVKA